MVVRKLALVLGCLLTLFAGSVSAQSEAKIRVVAPSISQIYDDLQWLIEQSPTADLKKQWAELKNNLLDAFTQGVDLKKPLEIDVVFRKSDLSYDWRVPIDVLTKKNVGFLEGIEGMGFKKKEITPKVYYEFAEKNKKPYYLRHDKGYAWISMEKSAVPGNPPLATQDMAALLAQNKDIVAELKNDAASMTSRRDTFKELRKQFEALIKFQRNEDKNAFELRKLALIQQLNEAERFIVESDTLAVGWTTTTSGPKPTGRGDVSVTALPGTDLQKSIEQFAVKPSYFANVELHPDALATGRITFPLDPMRIKHAKDFYAAVRPTLEIEIKAREGKTDDEKVALKQGMNKFLDMLDVGADLGVVDAFIDVHATAPKKNVMVCGIRAADGKVADEIINLLPKMKSDWQVKPLEEYGGVSIFELTIPETRKASFQRIFAGETALYVGTSKDAVWGAAGAEGLAQLKVAIDKTAAPASEKVDPIVISYLFNVSKLMTLMEIVEKETPKPVGKEQIQRQKDLEKYRNLADASMKDCTPLVTGELKRTDNKIEGFLELNECVLKYIGAMIADGTKALQ
ncbi:hypothetical protein [Schlesneria paludicola]|uniref:hypothetical protein n=1 Tax=Schlesneria paludicola TaxID=360056 RepID=UPI00029A56AD|nr:hypothetical protein [Schlesneria paludicola]